MQTDTWNGCYPSNWKGLIVDEAIVHPAKFSSKLIRRIYEHLFAESWLKESDVVIDPFGGVALGALDAQRCGLRWCGCELEQRFVDLGNANITYWNKRFSSLPKWNGDAVLLQGDSRELVRILGESCKGVVSSPPYADSFQGEQGSYEDTLARMEKAGHDTSKLGKLSNTAHLGYGSSSSNLGNMRGTEEGFSAAISSPAYGAISVEKNARRSINWEKQYETYKASGGGQTFEQFCVTQEKHSQGYGESEGQLSAMPFTEKGYQAAISGPPYADGAQHTGGDDTHPEHIKGGKIHLPGIAGVISSPPYAESMEHKGGIDPEKSEHIGGPHSQMNNSDTRYGTTPGQLGAMKADGFQASVSSPPFENSMVESGDPNYAYKFRNQKDYGDSAGQLGNDSGSDFWIAARQIVEQTYQVLSPGAHAVWVVKGFVKNKKLVDFPDQWRQLCESVGFVTLHEHHAMLVRHKGKQHTIEGGVKEYTTSSKSFFRRLAEKNGSPEINWETVFCMEKPL